MNTEEKQAEENERKIVRFKNIDLESFTHSFRGVSITIQAGEEYTGRFPECDHLATHLARKMLSREAKKNLPKDKTIKLWTPEQITKLKEDILTPIGQQEPKATYTSEEKRKEDIKEIEKDFVKPVPQVSKKEVIAELEKRGVKPDVKKSLEELLKELMDLEAIGKTKE